jgi:hypothetical protein
MSACSLAAGRHPRSEMVREVGRWLTEVIPGLLERGKTDEAAEVRAAVERWQQNLRMKAILVEPDGRLVPEDADLSLVAMDRPNFYFTTGGRVSTVWSWDRLRRSAPGGVWFGRFWILAVEAAVPLPEPQVTPKDPQPRGRNGCFTAKAKGAEVAP